MKKKKKTHHHSWQDSDQDVRADRRVCVPIVSYKGFNKFSTNNSTVSCQFGYQFRACTLLFVFSKQYHGCDSWGA